MWFSKDKESVGVADIVSDGWVRTSNVRWMTVWVYGGLAIILGGIQVAFGYGISQALSERDTIEAARLIGLSKSIPLVPSLFAYFLLCRLTVSGDRGALSNMSELLRDGLGFAWRTILLGLLLLVPLVIAETVANYMSASGLIHIVFGIMGGILSYWMFVRLFCAPLAAAAGHKISFAKSYQSTRNLGFETYISILVPGITFGLAAALGGFLILILFEPLTSDIKGLPGLLFGSFGSPAILAAALSYFSNVWTLGILACTNDMLFGVTDTQTATPSELNIPSETENPV